MLRMLQLIRCRVVWELILLIFYKDGMFRMVLIGRLLLTGRRPIPMFGLMVVSFVMRFLDLLLLVLGFMLACMWTPGGTVVGGHFDDLGLTS